jgi:hypothetical protein
MLAITGKVEYVEKALQPVEPLRPTSVVRRAQAAPIETPTVLSRVAINDLLPRFNDLLPALLAEGIRPEEFFGSTSDKPDKPQNFIVSFGEDASLSTLKRVIKICHEFGLDGVAASSSIVSAGRIYIGAYSYDGKERKFLRMSNAIVEMITSDAFTEADLRKLVPANPEK